MLPRGYVLSGEGVCYRTGVAVRTQTLEYDRWGKYLLGRLFESRHEEMRAELLIAENVLLPFYKDAHAAIKRLKPQSVARDLQKPAMKGILRRWEQIRDLIFQAFLASVNERVQEEVIERFISK